LTLTLNGKKRKLKRADFDNLLKAFKIDEKVIYNVYSKFKEVLPSWYNFIDISFLDEQMKEEYKQLVKKRAVILD